MAELLSIVNNYIGKYKIEDLLNKKIAIHTPDLYTFKIIQLKILELDSDADILSDNIYNDCKNLTCINIKDYCSRIIVNYCDYNWYEYSSYIIINTEDMLL